MVRKQHLVVHLAEKRTYLAVTLKCGHVGLGASVNVVPVEAAVAFYEICQHHDACSACLEPHRFEAAY